VEIRLAKSKIAGYQPGRGYSKADWDEVSDSPETTVEELAEAKRFAEVFPELAEKMRRTRGPQKTPTKVSVTLRLDCDVVERFRLSGKGWQARINDILRRA
jgi:uncharacterized protein (DUF4415 family)